MNSSTSPDPMRQPDPLQGCGLIFLMAIAFWIMVIITIVVIF